jgi:hypothetical protein
MLLSESIKLKAETELQETETRKVQALAQFREWIEKNSNIINCRNDENFLVRFLRAKKYSTALAFAMFEKFLMSSQIYKKWFRNLSIDDPRMCELYDSNCIVPLNKRDEDGARIILFQASKINTKKFTFDDMAKLSSIIVLTLLEEEETQIAGFVYIFDHKDISMDFISLFSLTDFKNHTQCILNAFPCRQKKVIIINSPSIAVTLIEFAKSLVSEKLKKRIFCYKGTENLHNHIDKRILPKEYGGEGNPVEDMKNEFKKMIKLQADQIKKYDEQEIRVISKEAEYTGSFRKLEID